jgi:tetratricopeptide (TPR) repeat protein
MRNTLVYLLTAVAISGTAASAQVSIIGEGLARDCFEAAKFQHTSLGEGETVCTQALQGELMKPTERSATYINRGVLRMRQELFDSAMADFRTAKKITPEQGAIFLNEGAVFILNGEHSDALAALNHAIALNSPDLHAAYYNRAVAKERTGDIAGAYFDYKKALELNPGWALATSELARFEVSAP